MKQASDDKQSLELKQLSNFPQPDLLMEYFWAVDVHPYHMVNDKKLISREEGVDFIPAWSLGRMIEGLPGVIEHSGTDSIEEDLTFDLQLSPQCGGKLAQVRYILPDGSKILFETEAIELLDGRRHLCADISQFPSVLLLVKTDLFIETCHLTAGL